MIDKDSFTEHIYKERLYLDFKIKDHFNYRFDRHKFPYFESIVKFLANNKKVNLYLTEKNNVKNFNYFGDDILANIDDLIKFCHKIGYSKKDQNRVKAFLGQHISIKNIQISEEEKREYIEANLSEQNLLDVLKNIGSDLQEKILETILKVTGDEVENVVQTSNDNLVRIFANFLNEGKVQNPVLESLPQIHLNVLQELKEFVEDNLDKDESFFQDWIDEDKGKFRKKRCLIFGLDYVDPKREGEINSRKRFDILATQNREHHILIELKSPKAPIFEIEKKANANDGSHTTYKLSKELSRAIPQILGYKRDYSQMSNDVVQQLGLPSKKEVSECIIIIGTRQEDPLWKENFLSLCESTKIKIWTYTDLVDKMGNTICNLRDNL